MRSKLVVKNFKQIRDCFVAYAPRNDSTRGFFNNLLKKDNRHSAHKRLRDVVMFAYVLLFLFGIYSFSSSVDLTDKTYFDCQKIIKGREDLIFYSQDQIGKMLEFCSYDEAKLHGKHRKTR